MSEREQGTVVWITGLPSSGKSELAGRALRSLRARGRPSCVLDGDAVRRALVPPPGYGIVEREGFYATLANLAALLARQGLVVLVPATAHRRAFRARAREVAPRFVEVLVAVSEAECRRRDAKGLYAAAAAGEVVGVPGAGGPGAGTAYEPPEVPDVVAQGGFDEAALEAIGRAVDG